MPVGRQFLYSRGLRLLPRARFQHDDGRPVLDAVLPELARDQQPSAGDDPAANPVIFSLNMVCAAPGTACQAGRAVCT